MGGYTLPSWAQAIGWLMALAPMAVIVCVATFKIFTSAAAHPTLSLFQVGGMLNIFAIALSIYFYAI